MTKFPFMSFLLLNTAILSELSSGLINDGKQTNRMKRSSVSVKKETLTKEKYRIGVCKKARDDLVVYNTTYGECIKECRSRYLCTAINLYAKVGVCRLNFHTNKQEVSCPKYIFSEKITWMKKSVPGCESIDCPINHKCLNVSGRFSCTPSECRNIESISNGVVFGSSVGFGMSRGFKCHEGFTLIGSSKVTCLASGEWNKAIPICTVTSFPEHTNEAVTSSQFDLTSSSQQPTLPLSRYSMVCDDSQPCSGENLECRNDSCLCVFGTVYEPEINTCVINDEKDDVKSNIADTECLYGWTRGPSHCYMFVDMEMTFEDAKANCEVLGGKLAEPMNTSDNDFIKSQIEYKKEHTISWIGLMENNRDWVWSSNGVTPSNYYWAQGHPNTYWTTETNNKNRDDGTYYNQCAAYNSIYVGWVNEPCVKPIYSICEIDSNS